jgi:serine/threonine-protein kinase
MQPLQATLDPQRRVGHTLERVWHLESLIGIGSTAAVYRATGPRGERVAVKVLHMEYAREDSVRSRFAREAYVANLVSHSGIVPILADGETPDGAPFLVMHLLEGETLEARWERKGGRLPVAEVLWYADRVLDVLHEAHAQGVVHRDIKPENIFLTHDREVKVLDFGIARLRAAAETAAPMTRAGSVIGTLAFMPPEQARGETNAVGVQTDLWAVGATMFTLLTGQLVHEGAEFHALLSNATQRAPKSLSRIAPALPNAVVELVDFALSFEVDRRWANARTMQRAVREVNAILLERYARAASLDDPSDDTAPVSEPLFELNAKPPSVDPPPMSRGWTAETLPPTAPRPEGREPSGGVRGAKTARPAAPRATTDLARVAGLAVLAVLAVMLIALWSARNR